jgi:hypothetical protein
MPEAKTLKTKAFFKLPPDHQTKLLNAMLSLCQPLRDEAELLGALEEAETFTLTRDDTKRLIAFRIGDIACPKEEDPSTAEDNPTKPGGRRKRRSRVKKQTRRTQRKRRNTIRK